MTRPTRIALWLWVGALSLFGIVLVAGGLFLAAVGEPNYQAFRRDMGRVMKTVKPLPEGLAVVDEWEECGQGADPMCDGVVLLVDDPRRTEPPIDAIRQSLLSRGWASDSERPELLRRPRSRFSSVEIRALEAVAAEDHASRFVDSFLRDHSAEGVAYVFVAP